MSETVATADALVDAGRYEDAAACVAAAGEKLTPDFCLKLARCYERLGDEREALRWALAATDTGNDFTSWSAAAGLARRHADAGDPPRRTARLARRSYTTSQLVTMLWLPALRIGIWLELYDSPYAQCRPEIIDPGSAMYAFEPEVVVLAVHDGELALPAYRVSPEEDVAAEVALAVTLADARPALECDDSHDRQAEPPREPGSQRGKTESAQRGVTQIPRSAHIATRPRSSASRVTESRRSITARFVDDLNGPPATNTRPRIGSRKTTRKTILRFANTSVEQVADMLAEWKSRLQLVAG